MNIFIKSIQLLSGFLFIGSMALNAQQMQMSQISPAKNVTDTELTQFIEVAKQFQEISIATDRLLFSKLEEVGMTGERFQEIMMSRQIPNSADIELSPQEESTITEMQMFLQQQSATMQQQQIEAVEKSELSELRFQGIAMSLQQDQALAERFQAVVSGNQ